MMMETIPPGTVVHSHYRVERALGSGGFGHVYLAVDLRTNQQCAVKEYLVSGSSGQAQLQHEARVLSRLHHPSLPTFIDAFSERGRYYIVLSYIDGKDLTDYIRMARQRNEVIPLQRIMSWLLAICDAVHFLHSQQPPVIHRDIKPDNIRITSDGTAILVDLGNAKAVADGARTLFFARHQGTPGYAPPEQYPGGSGTDARSDVYALGGTLYFALTTHEPPSVSTRNQAAQQGLPTLPLLREQLANNPPENSPEPAKQFRLGSSKPARPAPRHSRHLAQLGTLPPELLQHLDIIIQRAMALKPSERFQSAAQLGTELKKILDALPAPSSGNAQRPLDPNKTQPDLPQLYETLQAAQQQQQQQQAPGTVFSCPRCNTPLLRRSTFCPHCGALLSSNAAPNSGQPASGNYSGSSPDRQDKAGSISAQSPSPSGPATPARQQAYAPQFITENRPPRAAQQAVLARPGQAPRTPATRQQGGHTPPPGAQAPAIGGTSLNLRLAIIIAAIILLVLILLGILLIAINGAHQAGSLGSAVGRVMGRTTALSGTLFGLPV